MNRRQSGFSMVELLLAAFIVAVGLLGIASLQVMALRSTTGSSTRATAVYLAEGVMADIKASAKLRRTTKAGTAGGAPIFPTAGIKDYFGGAGPWTLYYDQAKATAGDSPWVDAAPDTLIYTLAISKTPGTAVLNATSYTQEIFTVSVSYQEAAGSNILTKQIQLVNMVSR